MEATSALDTLSCNEQYLWVDRFKKSDGARWFILLPQAFRNVSYCSACRNSMMGEVIGGVYNSWFPSKTTRHEAVTEG